MANREPLTKEELQKLKDFAIANKLNDKNLTEDRLLQYYYIYMRGKDVSAEQAYSWLRMLPEDEDNYLLVAKDIKNIYGDDYLSRANIIEVASGILPNLSERLMEIVPGIEKITVYDPMVIKAKSDFRLLRNKRAERIDIKKELFTPETPLPIEESRPTLLISRHPCGGTPALIEVAGHNINVDLYAVLCDCDDEQINISTYSYYRDRGEQPPKYHHYGGHELSKIRLFQNPSTFREFNWQQYSALKLRKDRPEVLFKSIEQVPGVHDSVIYTPPRTR